MVELGARVAKLAVFLAAARFALAAEHLAANGVIWPTVPRTMSFDNRSGR